MAREAFSGGQQAIQMQSYPFHMTPENMAKYRADPNIAFWRQLKEGADNFEIAKQDVNVGVCAKHYVFNVTARNLDPVGACPTLQHDGIQNEVAAREAEDDAKTAKLAASGTPAVRTLYADGGQNPEFAKANLADVSRPEALAAAPTDWIVEPADKKKTSAVVKVAAKKASTTAVAKAPKDKTNEAAADRTATVGKPQVATNPHPQAAL